MLSFCWSQSNKNESKIENSKKNKIKYDRKNIMSSRNESTVWRHWLEESSLPVTYENSLETSHLLITSIFTQCCYIKTNVCWVSAFRKAGTGLNDSCTVFCIASKCLEFNVTVVNYYFEITNSVILSLCEP